VDIRDFAFLRRGADRGRGIEILLRLVLFVMWATVKGPRQEETRGTKLKDLRFTIDRPLQQRVTKDILPSHEASRLLVRGCTNFFETG